MGDSELITVYRSADTDADLDAKAVQAILESNGLHPVVYNDDSAGVVEGSFEVRVPISDAARAEEILAMNPEAAEEHFDNSSGLDLVTIFRSEASATAELEAMSIKAFLDGAGIESVLMGSATLPNLPFEIKVPQDRKEEAERVIAEAQATGPAEAERAEAESEVSGI